MHDLDDILARKLRLRSDIERQRGHLAVQVDALQPLFSGADRAVAGARWVRAHAAWVAAGVAAVLVMAMRRPKTTGGTITALALLWLRRGLLAWRTGSWILGLVQDARRKA